MNAVLTWNPVQPSRARRIMFAERM